MSRKPETVVNTDTPETTTPEATTGKRRGAKKGVKRGKRKVHFAVAAIKDGVLLHHEIDARDFDNPSADDAKEDFEAKLAALDATLAAEAALGPPPADAPPPTDTVIRFRSP